MQHTNNITYTPRLASLLPRDKVYGNRVPLPLCSPPAPYTLLPLAPGLNCSAALPYEIQIHDDGRQVALHVSNSVRGSFRSQHWTEKGEGVAREGGGAACGGLWCDAQGY